MARIAKPPMRDSYYAAVWELVAVCPRLEDVFVFEPSGRLVIYPDTRGSMSSGERKLADLGLHLFNRELEPTIDLNGLIDVLDDVLWTAAMKAITIRRRGHA